MATKPQSPETVTLMGGVCHAGWLFGCLHELVDLIIVVGSGVSSRSHGNLRRLREDAWTQIGRYVCCTSSTFRNERDED